MNNSYHNIINNKIKNIPSNITLSSTVLTNNSEFPKNYTCDGENIMIPLSWTTLSNVSSYALICVDTHPIANRWVHLYIPILIPNNKNNSKINYPNVTTSLVATNSFGKRGYDGPCPPENSGIHNYIFYIFGLNGIVKENEDSCKDVIQFLEMCEKQNIQIIGYGILQGTYIK